MNRAAYIKPLGRLLCGVAMGCLLTAGIASAAPISFTWAPLAVGIGAPGDGLIGPANNFTVVDTATVNLTGSGFTEIGALRINDFLLGSTLAPSAGLETHYSLLFGFTGTGNPIAIPAPGSSSTAAFTSLNYTLYGLTGVPPTITPTTDVSKIPNVVALAFGSLVSGTATLVNQSTPNSVDFSPKADLNLNMTVCTAAGQGNTGFGNSLCTGNESAFFASPLPANISLLIGDFSATTSVTTLSGSTLTINGGGGNLTLEQSAVPEPGSVMLLGFGLTALGFVKRRKKV